MKYLILIMSISFVSGCSGDDKSHRISEQIKKPYVWNRMVLGVGTPDRLENKEAVCYKYAESLQCIWKYDREFYR